MSRSHFSRRHWPAGTQKRPVWLLLWGQSSRAAHGQGRMAGDSQQTSLRPPPVCPGGSPLMAQPGRSLKKHFDQSRSPVAARILARGRAPSPAQDQPCCCRGWGQVSPITTVRNQHQPLQLRRAEKQPQASPVPSDGQLLTGSQGVAGGAGCCSPPKPEPGLPLPCRHCCSQLHAAGCSKLPALLRCCRCSAPAGLDTCSFGSL